MKKPNVLKEILQFKEKEVEERKNQVPLKELEAMLGRFKPRNFKEAVSSRKKAINLIAEVKKASPSNGVIRQNFDLEKIVEAYNRHAQAISVITDEKFFQGKLEYLEKVRGLSELPVLRKDFIIDAYQVFESRAFGADAILLIAAALSKDRMKRLYLKAKQIGMQCLVEVHSSQDLEKALPLRCEAVGINNRSLETLQVDLRTTINLREMLPDSQTVVSESGFNSAADIASVRGKADAVLIGTAFMRAENIEAKMMELGF